MSVPLLALHLRAQPSWVAVETTDVASVMEELEFELEGTDWIRFVLSELDDASIAGLDPQRSRYVGDVPVLFVGNREDISRLAQLAPHCWGLIGPDVWTIEREEGVDVEARLRQLEIEHQVTSKEFVRRAETGALDPEPVWAEWAALLGRGDLFDEA